MTDAILLVGHGTRNPEGIDQFLQLSDLLRAAVAPLPLKVVFIELQSPTMEQALAELCASGLKDIALSPALLFAAGHAKQDIPAAIERARAQHPDLKVTIAQPLGCHEALVELAASRFLAALASGPPSSMGQDERPRQHQNPAAPSVPALVVVGRGSSDPDAIHHCREFAAELGRRVQVIQVFTAFLAIAQPSLPAALEQAARCGATQVVVQPHLLFRGEMLETTTAAVESARQMYRDIDWRQAEILGSDLLDPAGAAAKYLMRSLLARLQQTEPQR